MSVQLRVLSDRICADVELMAPDFDAHYVWLWLEGDGANRIDLSRKQMRELRDALNELLPAPSIEGGSFVVGSCEHCNNDDSQQPLAHECHEHEMPADESGDCIVCRESNLARNDFRRERVKR